MITKTKRRYIWLVGNFVFFNVSVVHQTLAQTKDLGGAIAMGILIDILISTVAIGVIVVRLFP